MNAYFTRYDIATGRGVDTITIPDKAEWKNPYFDGIHALYRGRFDCITQYMAGGAVVDRPASGATCDRFEIDADGQDVATIAGLPDPCSVRIAGPVSADIEVTGGWLEFTAATPGEYRITGEAFPVQRYEVVIHAI